MMRATHCDTNGGRFHRPGMALRVDGTHYFDIHHTQADTMDKIDPHDLAHLGVSHRDLFALGQRHPHVVDLGELAGLRRDDAGGPGFQPCLTIRRRDGGSALWEGNPGGIHDELGQALTGLLAFDPNSSD